MSTIDPPPLTVVVPSRKPWPDAESAVRAALTSVARVGGDVVLAAAHPQGAPPAPIDGVTVIGASAVSVFSARSSALHSCRGEIVAVIEDHCFAPESWAGDLLRAWGRSPEAQGMISRMANGAPSLLDRCSFLLTWAPFIGPLPTVPLDRLPAPGVVSYRGDVIRSAPVDDDGSGWMEYDLPSRLRDEGAMAVADDVTMLHTQHLGWRAFPLQYWAGRGFTGAGRDAPGTRRARIRRASSIPMVLVRQTRAAIRANEAWRAGPAVAVVIAVMALCNGVGQVVGVLTGSPGRALEMLE